MNDVLKAWNARQEKVHSARFELRWDETIHKGSTSEFEALQTRDPQRSRAEPNPPTDHHVTNTAHLTIKDAKLRYAYEKQQWDPIGKRLYSKVYVDSFDGDVFKPNSRMDAATASTAASLSRGLFSYAPWAGRLMANSTGTSVVSGAVRGV
jgi:hypothetical protein